MWSGGGEVYEREKYREIAAILSFSSSYNNGRGKNSNFCLPPCAVIYIPHVFCKKRKKHFFLFPYFKRRITFCLPQLLEQTVNSKIIYTDGGRICLTFPFIPFKNFRIISFFFSLPVLSGRERSFTLTSSHR